GEGLTVKSGARHAARARHPLFLVPGSRAAGARRRFPVIPAPAVARRGRGRGDARSHPTRRRAPARGRGGSSPGARAGRAGSETGRGNGSARDRADGRSDGGACSPPFLVACEKSSGAFLRAAQGVDPLLEEQSTLLGERV